MFNKIKSKLAEFCNYRNTLSAAVVALVAITSQYVFDWHPQFHAPFFAVFGTMWLIESVYNWQESRMNREWRGIGIFAGFLIAISNIPGTIVLIAGI